MIFELNKMPKFVKKNIELVFLFLLTVITIASTTFYNNNKRIISDNYKDVINNIYFQKSVKHIFNSLSPRYIGIDHKISNGETFDKILKKYSVPDEEIIKIKKNLNINYNKWLKINNKHVNNLMTYEYKNKTLLELIKKCLKVETTT